MPRVALYTAAAIFALVSGLHWARYFMGFKIIIDGTTFPGVGSLIIGVVAGILAAWMILAGRRI